MTPNKVACAKITDALPEICSERYMPEIAAEVREEMAEQLLRTEGSSEDTGMTCIAEEDYPQLADEFNAMYAQGAFDHYSLPNAVQGRLRALNRHCDECRREGCKNRVELTREQIRRMSGFGILHLNSRKAKVGVHKNREKDGGRSSYPPQRRLSVFGLSAPSVLEQ